MKNTTHRSILVLVFFLTLFTCIPASAQWVRQNTPKMNGLYTMRAVGKNAMWTSNVNLGGLDTAHMWQYIRTGDGGKTYDLKTILPKEQPAFICYVHPFDAKTAYLLAAPSTEGSPFIFRHTVDSGATWKNMPFTPPTFPGLIHFYDANNGTYLGDPDSLGFYAAYTTDGGNIFTRIPQSNLPQPDEGEFTQLGGFQVLGDNLFMTNYYFNGETGEIKWRIMRSTDRGRTWTSGEWFNNGELFEARFAFTDADNGMVHRGWGTIDKKSPLYTTNGGATWHESGQYPGLVSFPVDVIPNTKTLVSIFQDTVKGVTFTAATNDYGKTWNSRKDVGPSILDRRYAESLGLDYYVNGQLEIVDNYTAWAQFSNTAIHRYESTTPLVPEQPDLDLELKADNEGLPLYGYVKYTLSVRNRGISPATGVKINWLPPYKRTDNGTAPYAFTSAYSDKGRYDSWNGVWTIDKLDAGAIGTASFHLFVLDNSRDVSQTAQVTACNEKDLDSSPNNMVGAAKEDDEVGYISKARNNMADMPNDVLRTIYSDFDVSPNPVRDRINITINPKKDTDWSIRVLNNIGQMVYTQSGLYSKNIEVDAQNFENGLYIIEYQSEGERKIEKVMIQH